MRCKRGVQYHHMRDWLERDEPTLPSEKDAPTLLRDLAGIYYKYDSNGRYQLLLKEEIKKRLDLLHLSAVLCGHQAGVVLLEAPETRVRCGGRCGGRRVIPRCVPYVDLQVAQ